jgi:hypothetical protein
MGYTSFTKEKIQAMLDMYDVKSIIDLGAQNDYGQPSLPAPYISEWYKEKKIKYESIDLSGENNCLKFDLSIPIIFYWEMELHKYKLVVDAGTSEHIGRDGKFCWEAIYNCWKNKFDLLEIGGIMYSENPKYGNWPGHGFNYYTFQFYLDLSKISGLSIIGFGEHAAMGNVTDGWNIWCTMIKMDEDFPSLEQFRQLDLRQS